MMVRAAVLLVACADVRALLVPRPGHGAVRSVRIARRMSDDSWAVELKQAGGGFDDGEAAPWLKGGGGGGDAGGRERNEGMMEWLTASGVWVSELSGWNEAPHAMALATTTFDELEGEDSGRGLLARRAIAQEAELVRVPVRICLTLEAACACPELRGVVDGDTNEYVAIALLLILERAKGERSFWAPYVRILPTVEDVSATFSWPDDELESLAGSPVGAATASMKAKLRSEHAAVVSGGGVDPKVVTFAAWEWAFSTLFSRAIRLKSGREGELLALVPYVDFINHSPFSSSYVDARPIPKAFPWEPEEDEVVLFSDRSYKKFEQVFISYGPRSNADLLLLYGFALDRNPFNAVAIAVGAVEGNDPLFEAKAAFAARAGRDARRATFPLYADRYPDELLQFLRMACATPTHLGKCPLDDPSTYVAPLCADNERAVLETIRAACAAALGAYPDVEEVPAAFLTRNGRMARRLVETEKRILAKTLAAVAKQDAALANAPDDAFARRAPDVLSDFK